MLRYLLKRLLLLIPVIICVSFIMFALMDLAPGTIIDAMISEAATPEDIAALMAKYDLDKPLIYRYGKYMFNLIQGDLGLSQVSGTSVWSLYITKLPNTLLLSLAALVIGSAISIPMGIRAARHAGKITDTATTTFTLIGMSMPSFWLGLILLIVFSSWLGWLPAGGADQGIKSFILPAVCSGLMLMANSTRQTRSSMLEVLNSDYLRTARAKGVPEEVVIRKHALGNAWIPILTTIGTTLSISLAGSSVIESVFAWPGVGRAIVDAVMARDVTATCGLVIMTTILYVLLQLVVDLLYAFVDPRIKSQYSGGGKKKKKASAETSSRDARRLHESVAALLPETQSDAPDISPADIPEGLSGGDANIGSARQGSGLFGQEKLALTQVDSEDSRPEQTESTADVYDAGNTVLSKGGADSVLVVDAEQVQNRGGSGNAKTIVEDKAIAVIMKKYKKRSQIGEIFHRIRQNKSAMAGLIILSLLFLVLIGSLFISYESVTATNSADRFAKPSWRLPFGADLMGRNAFLRVIYGTRYSMIIGFGAVAIATALGVILGSFAGYYGGLADDIIMRFSDVVASIPGLLLGMVIVAVLGQSLPNLIVAVGITAMPVFIRITRASILSVRNNEFVEAARAIGISNLRTVFTQVLPNGLSPIIVTVTASLGISIITAASLSFLGFGVPVPHPEWGALVSGGRNYIRSAPYLTTFPGLFIMITVLAFNLLGDGLRDALDPKLKR